jgi:Domain of unknown function (DUF5666)
MQRRHLFGLLLRGAVAGGALATTFGTGTVFAHHGQSHGKGKGQSTGQQGLDKKRRGVSGELTKVEGNAPTLTLTLRTKPDGAVQVLTTGQTVFRGKDHDQRSLAGLANLTGRLLNARGEWNANGDLVAAHLIVRSEAGDDGRSDQGGRGDRERATGTISAVSDVKLTVKQADTTEHVFTINKDTEIRIDAEFGVGLKTGQSVRVTGRKVGSDTVATTIRVPAGS